jgi:hypothetical protein
MVSRRPSIWCPNAPFCGPLIYSRLNPAYISTGGRFGVRTIFRLALIRVLFLCLAALSNRFPQVRITMAICPVILHDLWAVYSPPASLGCIKHPSHDLTGFWFLNYSACNSSSFEYYLAMLNLTGISSPCSSTRLFVKSLRLSFLVTTWSCYGTPHASTPRCSQSFDHSFARFDANTQIPGNLNFIITCV